MCDQQNRESYDMVDQIHLASVENEADKTGFKVRNAHGISLAKLKSNIKMRKSLRNWTHNNTDPNE